MRPKPHPMNVMFGAQTYTLPDTIIECFVSRQDVGLTILYKQPLYKSRSNCAKKRSPKRTIFQPPYSSSNNSFTPGTLGGEDHHAHGLLTVLLYTCVPHKCFECEPLYCHAYAQITDRTWYNQVPLAYTTTLYTVSCCTLVKHTGLTRVQQQ